MFYDFHILNKKNAYKPTTVNCEKNLQIFLEKSSRVNSRRVCL